MEESSKKQPTQKLLYFHRSCVDEFRELLLDFNLLFYGYGCKKNILTELFPEAAIYNLLLQEPSSIIDELRYEWDITRKCRTFEDLDYELLEKNEEKSLILQNFNFKLSSLKGLKAIKLIATIEYTDYTCDMNDIAEYNFIFRDLTTFEDYTDEVIGMELSCSKVGSVIRVLNSVSPNSRRVFIALLETGSCSDAVLFEKIKYQLLLTQRSALTSLLTEFFEHEIVKETGKGRLHLCLSEKERKELLKRVAGHTHKTDRFPEKDTKFLYRGPNMEKKVTATSNLDEQFGYEEYLGSAPRIGWLLSFYISKNELTELKAILYFVDEFNSNFKVEIPHFASFLVSSEDLATDEDDVECDLVSCEEHLRRRYEGQIYSMKTVCRIDTKEKNHLNKPPKKYLKVEVQNESSFAQITKELLTAEKRRDRYEGVFFSGQFKTHEYDIPHEITFANEMNVRAGKWYSVSYSGERYRIEESEKITYPDLRMVAFDIETTKPPLKFPNADNDQIMMISVMGPTFGELIVNREIVSRDVRPFEYEARSDMKQVFEIKNEMGEEELINRFITLLREYKPHIITTFNGGFFDWPFVDKRASKYGISLRDELGVRAGYEYYDAPFMIHLDCFKWVKRDSYLPMNSHGLKAVTRIKLGYFPDEIDPEEMVRYAKEDPQHLASYSVSDAVATYFLYEKYVHPHIFSICSLIPLPPAQILCRGSGTLCEALLVSEAVSYGILVPPKKEAKGLEFYNGRVIDSLTYVGGHVESLHAGIFRADFTHNFNIHSDTILEIISNIDQILEEYTGEPKYENTKEELINKLKGLIGIKCQNGSICHLDVGAMYPNIILTNRMQPISIVTEDTCIHCEYSSDTKCKRKMKWISRAEVYPPSKSEVKMLINQLEYEAFPSGKNSESVNYLELPKKMQESILRQRLTEYSKKIYKKVRTSEVTEEEVTVCQREVPFYVETVRKFRDQRYVYKDAYKKAQRACEDDPSMENKKKLVIYNSLQVAYKCVLNSFYGYVMRTGSRWFSLEMAAAVCYVGGEIIRSAKAYVERIGMPLELDTDGIWCIIPRSFPYEVTIGTRRVSVLSNLLNYFVCRTFTNDQYFNTDKFCKNITDVKEDTVESHNSIFFEMDGPYHTMIIPSSTEENHLLKKRYAVFDEKNKIVELKGFELKRRGELNFIKRFQEELFQHFNDGNTLEECYDALGKVCNYWLDIIITEGAKLDETTLFELFSESRSMSKAVDEYGNRKSTILGTARKIAEFLGDDMLQDKLKCEFIISRFPENAPTADRAIPVIIFKHPQKELYLRKWQQCSCTDLHKIIDWEYYRRRFESIVQRMVCIPAYFQGIKNPVPRVDVPKWIRDSGRERLKFACDIEETGNKENNRIIKRRECNVMEERRVEFKDEVFLISIKIRDGEYIKIYSDGREERKELTRDVYIALEPVGTELPEKFKSCERIVFSTVYRTEEYLKMGIKESEYTTQKYQRFFEHVAVRRRHTAPHILYQIINNNKDPCGIAVSKLAFISSFLFNNKRVFCVSYNNVWFITEGNWHKKLSLELNSEYEIVSSSLKSFRKKELKGIRGVVVSSNEDLVVEEVFEDIPVLRVKLKLVSVLGGIEGIMKRHAAWHIQLKEEVFRAAELSAKYSIPILNLLESDWDEVLDVIFYKELINSKILVNQDDEIQHTASSFEDEQWKSGYYPTFCLAFECVGTAILAVVEHRMIIEKFSGSERRDFGVLSKLLRQLVVDSVRGSSAADALLRAAARWMKRGSKLLSSGLREVVDVLQRRFLAIFISELRNLQCKVVAISKELVIIETGKKDLEGCIAYEEYTRKKLMNIPGMELLKLRRLRCFEKLGFIDFNNFFYVENGEIKCFSGCELPYEFFRVYFSDDEIRNEQVYDIVTKLSAPAAKMLLRMLSYKRDTHGLASNCYKLLRISPFEEVSEYKANLVLFCDLCGFENLLRRKCVKCHGGISRQCLEDAAQEYLMTLWALERKGERYCVLCGGGEVRRLREYCRCGGRFVRRKYLDEIQKLEKFVGTPRFSELTQNVFSYFGKC